MQGTDRRPGVVRRGAPPPGGRRQFPLTKKHMTNTQVGDTNLVVVDGSNIATEGRSIPSLTQLNDAVLSLTREFPEITVTVVVDATFGHRIDKSEVPEFDEAVAHNELVTPPAGAIGRGDAFVLSIANKVGARIFSNDSFQEFHGVYPWLFDEGRLIGGKPVPNVGWVFVNRVPVKGPLSRKARGTGRESAARRVTSPLASLPMPVPTRPPPRTAAPAVAEPVARAVAEPVARAVAEAAAEIVGAAEAEPGSGRGRRRKSVATVPVAPIAAASPVNNLLPFLDFIQNHPVGSEVSAQVESYSSHGAYVSLGDLRGYVPLRLMGSPPPRSARDVMRLGDDVDLVVASFAPARRSVDLAVPAMVPEGAPDEPPTEQAGPAEQPARKRTATKRTATKRTAATTAAASNEALLAEPSAQDADAGASLPAKRSRAKKAATQTTTTAAAKRSTAAKRATIDVTTAPAEPVPAKKAARKRAAAKPVAAKPAATNTTTAKRTTKTAPAHQATSPLPPTKRSRTKAAAATNVADSDSPAARAKAPSRRATAEDPGRPAGPAEPEPPTRRPSKRAAAGAASSDGSAAAGGATASARKRSAAPARAKAVAPPAVAPRRRNPAPAR